MDGGSVLGRLVFYPQKTLRIEIAEWIAKINAELKLLDKWLEDKANHAVFYIGEVKNARAMLAGLLDESQAHEYRRYLEELQHQYHDLRALNKALYHADISDLLTRAQRRFEYVDPLAVAIGVALVVIGVSLMVAAGIMPTLLMLGILACMLSATTIAFGVDELSTIKRDMLFSIAKGIRPELDKERDLHQSVDSRDMIFAMSHYPLYLS